jgi:hypothetical protein
VARSWRLQRGRIRRERTHIGLLVRRWYCDWCRNTPVITGQLGSSPEGLRGSLRRGQVTAGSRTTPPGGQAGASRARMSRRGARRTGVPDGTAASGTTDQGTAGPAHDRPLLRRPSRDGATGRRGAGHTGHGREPPRPGLPFRSCPWACSPVRPRDHTPARTCVRECDPVYGGIPVSVARELCRRTGRHPRRPAVREAAMVVRVSSWRGSADRGRY